MSTQQRAKDIRVWILVAAIATNQICLQATRLQMKLGSIWVRGQITTTQALFESLWNAGRLSQIKKVRTRATMSSSMASIMQGALNPYGQGRKENKSTRDETSHWHHDIPRFKYNRSRWLITSKFTGDSVAWIHHGNVLSCVGGSFFYCVYNIYKGIGFHHCLRFNPSCMYSYVDPFTRIMSLRQSKYSTYVHVKVDKDA